MNRIKKITGITLATVACVVFQAQGMVLNGGIVGLKFGNITPKHFSQGSISGGIKPFRSRYLNNGSRLTLNKVLSRNYDFNFNGGSVNTDDTAIICKDGVCSIKERKHISPTIEVKKRDMQEDAIVELTTDNFEGIVKKTTKPVIIDFYATWCQPCKLIKPTLCELAQEKKDWIFAAIDVDKVSKIAADCGIQAMPTFVIFKNGIQWGSIKGVLPKEELVNEFEKIINANSPIPSNKADQVQQLIMAICQCNREVTKKLIAQGVDVNGCWETPQGNFYPLKAAIMSGTEEIIDLLIQSGAFMDRTIEESTIKQIETFEKMQTVQQECFDYANNKLKAIPASGERMIKISESDELRQQFMRAINDTKALKNLIENGADVNMPFALGNWKVTPLYLAIAINNKEAIEMLVDAGASFDTEIANEHGDKTTVETKIKQDIENGHQGLIKARERLAYTLNKVSQKV